MEQFSSRFADVRGHKTDFKLFGTPFGVEVDEVSDDLQMEIIQLQNDELLKYSYNDLMQSKRAKDLCLLEFYKVHVQSEGHYPNLIDHAKKFACVFGSTFSCEQLFSKLKVTKNKMRTNLTDTHLDDALRLAATTLTPNIEKLSKETAQHQPSH